MGLAAGLTAAAAVAGSLASIGTGIANTVQSSKEAEDQKKREKRQQELAKRQFDKRNRARAGFQGTILSDRGLGGQQAVSTGAATLLGG